ncbi:hypothetical protein DFJ73DRAFT_767287 [Zopfochytrium polystomum]|nr:hypothetical protein DFJ73DRAFT_767287 [Zopfochytrium polystomum]
MSKLGVTLERPLTVLTSGDQQQFNNHITLVKNKLAKEELYYLIESDYKQEEKPVIPPPVAMVNPEIDPPFNINTQEYHQASEDNRYTNLKREHDTVMDTYLKKLEKYEEYLHREASASFTRTFHNAHVNIKLSRELLKAIITTLTASSTMEIPLKVLDADILVPHLEKWRTYHYEFVSMTQTVDRMKANSMNNLRASGKYWKSKV